MTPMSEQPALLTRAKEQLVRRSALVVVVLLCAFFLQATFSMRLKSNTFDEMNHIAAGYLYAKEHVFTRYHWHPPLIRLIIGTPLLFLPLRMPEELKILDEPLGGWRFSHRFLYGNTVPAETIIFWARLPIVLLGMLLAYGAYRWARALFGTGAGLLALLLCAFSPSLLAHSRLATTDLGIACFLFLAVYAFWWFTRQPSLPRLLVAGALGGLALSAKFSGVILIPIIIVLAGTCWVSGPHAAGSESRSIGSLAPTRRTGVKFRHLAIVLAVWLGTALFVLSLTYGLTSVSAFWDGLRMVEAHEAKGHPTFLMGAHSDTGWWYYFPLAFLIKTPIPLLCFIVMGLISMLRSRGSPSLVDKSFLLLPVVVIFGVTLFIELRMGLRHLLPVYPFLIVIAAGSVTLPVMKSATLRNVGMVLGAWYVLEALAIYPHYLAYFNELVGGPGRGYKYLVDSNLDWGQDLKLLKRYMDERGTDEVALCYFGTADPNYYGIKYQYVPGYALYPNTGHVIALNASPQLLAVSATNLQSVYFADKKMYRWLLEFTPEAKIGHSIFVYDMTADAEIHNGLGLVYLKSGLLAEAESEFRHAIHIDPTMDKAFTNLASVYMARGEHDKAGTALKEVLTANPSYGEAHFQLGALNYAASRVGEAEACYRRAISLDPAHARAHGHLGILLLREGQTKEAEAMLRRAIELDPEMVEARVALGSLLGRKGRLREAMAELEAALAINKQYPPVHQNLSAIYHLLGDEKRAREERRIWLELTAREKGGRDEVSPPPP